MNINDKIKQILIDKNLTPSYFADEIGVQRSSISHILSGRNRPSFDIIQKIIRRFPELGYEWIMEEDTYSIDSTGSTPSRYAATRAISSQSTSDRYERPSPVPQQRSSSPVSNAFVRTHRHEISADLPEQNVPETATKPTEPTTPGSSQFAERKVERILVFYTDGSFKEFTPA